MLRQSQCEQEVEVPSAQALQDQDILKASPHLQSSTQITAHPPVLSLPAGGAST